MGRGKAARERGAAAAFAAEWPRSRAFGPARAGSNSLPNAAAAPPSLAFPLPN